jgi:DNA-directed RNA polymerase specialized sigma24 family protein
MRLYQRLLRFFEWRGCHHPEEAADSTLDRVEIKLEQRAKVPNVQAFVTGVARLVSLEHLRAQSRFVPLPINAEIESQQVGSDEDEGALACLESCLTKLQPENRKLIRGYYESRDRAALALDLGVNINVLRLRAKRLRGTLEQCIVSCLRKSEV